MSAEGISQIPAQFMFCRDVLHAWQPYDAKILTIKPKKGRARKEVHRILRCIRCETLKTQKLSVDGSILGHSYNYPTGYVNVGQGRLTVQDRAKLRKLNIESTGIQS